MTPGRRLLVDAHDGLQRALSEPPPSEVAHLLARWLLPLTINSSVDTAATVRELLLRSGAQQDFQTVSALGYAAAAGLVAPADTAVVRQGLRRVAGRRAFVDGVPMPFCLDAVGVLGIALGTNAVADAALTSEIASWLAGFLGSIYGMTGVEDWQRCVFNAADGLMGAPAQTVTITTVSASDARVALASKGILPALSADEEGAALELIARESVEPLLYERAVLRFSALTWLIRTVPVISPERISVEGLVRLLTRVPAGLRKWTWENAPRTTASETRRWHVDHEYHVQNLLWMLLSPIFPDLDDEQYLTKIGQKNPRSDFYIPSMKVIVEAKFLRPSERIQKIIDEIAADLSLYRALGNECAGVIPFIWDDGARTNEHDYLRQGLKKMPGLLDAVIVSRPTDWATAHSEASGRRRKRPTHRTVNSRKQTARSRN